jgi:hypothetical protein
MTKTNKAFRVIVIKRNITPMLPNLEDGVTTVNGNYCTAGIKK